MSNEREPLTDSAIQAIRDLGAAWVSDTQLESLCAEVLAARAAIAQQAEELATVRESLATQKQENIQRLLWAEKQGAEMDALRRENEELRGGIQAFRQQQPNLGEILREWKD